MPGLLLLVARDLLVNDPPRVLAWRLLHEPRLAEVAGSLGPLVPRPPASLDSDPAALALAALAAGLAAVYLVAGLAGLRARGRALLLALAATLVVVLPTAAFVRLGLALDRPYGQDGGVVQLPIALELLLAGQSPYAADYSATALGRVARASDFWAPLGGNPILRHHAYLPGTHLLVLPFFLVSRSLVGFFDPRLVTLLALAAAAWLAGRLVSGAAGRLTAAALVLVNPLVYWHQIFGANDLLFVAVLLAAAVSAQRGRSALAGGLVGLACATKQLAWPFAPFLLVHLSGARGFAGLVAPDSLKRLARPLVAAAIVFAAVVLPVALLDARAFWDDIVVYNLGLPGGDSYPFGGTPGLGFANLLLYAGVVHDLAGYFPFGVFYLLLVPLGLLLLRLTLREGTLAAALLAGSVALCASLYLSRVVHANYFLPAAILLPLAVLMRGRGGDVALVPLLLVGAATEIAGLGALRAVWEQAEAIQLPRHLAGLPALLAPRTGSLPTGDPLSLAWSALAAGLGVVYLAAAALGAARRWRLLLIAAGAVLIVGVPTWIVSEVGSRGGVVRAQQPWAVQVPAAVGRLLRLESPYSAPRPQTPTARQAWSTSFRREPPRLLEPEPPLLPPGTALLALPAGQRDPRPLAVLALLVAGLALWRLSPGGTPAALALVLPPAALGAVFGSGVAVPLALLLGAALAGLRGRPVLAAGLAGFAGACDWLALAALPPLLLEPAARIGWRRAIGVAGIALLVPVAGVGLLDPSALLNALVPAHGVAPGLGLVNLLLYAGRVPSTALATALLVGAAACALGTLTLAAVHRRTLAAAALATLTAAWLAPQLSVEALWLPLGLLAAAGLRDEG